MIDCGRPARRRRRWLEYGSKQILAKRQRTVGVERSASTSVEAKGSQASTVCLLRPSVDCNATPATIINDVIQTEGATFGRSTPNIRSDDTHTHMRRCVLPTHSVGNRPPLERQPVVPSASQSWERTSLARSDLSIVSLCRYMLVI